MKLCAYMLLSINNLISIYICTVFHLFAKQHLQCKFRRQCLAMKGIQFAYVIRGKPGKPLLGILKGTSLIAVASLTLQL